MEHCDGGEEGNAVHSDDHQSDSDGYKDDKDHHHNNVNSISVPNTANIKRQWLGGLVSSSKVDLVPVLSPLSSAASDNDI